jgi:hypothetical protein
LVVRTLYEENIKFTLDQSSSLDDWFKPPCFKQCQNQQLLGFTAYNKNPN